MNAAEKYRYRDLKPAQCRRLALVAMVAVIASAVPGRAEAQSYGGERGGAVALLILAGFTSCYVATPTYSLLSAPFRGAMASDYPGFFSSFKQDTDACRRGYCNLVNNNHSRCGFIGRDDPETTPLALNAAAENIQDNEARVALELVLAQLEKSPESPQLQEQLNLRFLKLCEEKNSESDKLLSKALHRIREYALRGGVSAIEALMLATQTPYGMGTHPHEELNAVLWEIFEEHPRATLEALASVPTDKRKWLVEWVYTRPIHPDFDFRGIGNRLATITPPESVREDFATIQAALPRLVEFGAAHGSKNENE